MARSTNQESKGKYVQDTFNAIAGNYDLMNTIMTLGLDRYWRKLVVKHAEIAPYGIGLDICCGTGMLTRELARTAGPHGEIVGLDFSEKMLAVARQKTQKFRYRDSITFVQGDAMRLPFADNSFDCVTVGWGLRNVPIITKVIKEMNRVVSPGGKIVSIDMGKPTLPIFKEVYWYAFRKVVPVAGKMFSGNKKAYDYLHDSSRDFIDQEGLARLFSEAGLVEVGYRNLLSGVVAIVDGRKDD